MNRHQRFLSLRSHPWLSKDFAKLTKPRMAECLAFLAEHEDLSDDEFMLRLNRWRLDDPKRPKDYPIQWGLLSQSIETLTRRFGKVVQK